MKNIVITILVILVLGLGGYLVLNNNKVEEPSNLEGEKTEEYTVVDKNNASIRSLYESSKLTNPMDKVYTTASLKVENRSQADKYCTALEITDQYSQNFTKTIGNENLNGTYDVVKENNLKISYEKIFGLNTYVNTNEINCRCARYVYDSSESAFILVEGGCGGDAGYEEEIEEVRRYNDRIEIISVYYYQVFALDEDSYNRICTDETCTNVVLETSNYIDSENIVATYKNKLNRLVYTYKLSEDGFYYFTGTEVKAS